MSIFAISVLTDPVHNFTRHWDDILFGMFTWSVIGHAVQKFPPSNNPYVNWVIGTIQFAVGQRERAQNTMNGKGTITVPNEK